VKNVPGRAKTDKADAVWLAKVAERGMCRPSLVHPKPIRELRNLTRYRCSLIRDRTREMQRVEKLLEDAQIKITSVVSDVFGLSGGLTIGASCRSLDRSRCSVGALGLQSWLMRR
jgi:transposase